MAFTCEASCCLFGIAKKHSFIFDEGGTGGRDELPPLI